MSSDDRKDRACPEPASPDLFAKAIAYCNQHHNIDFAWTEDDAEVQALVELLRPASAPRTETALPSVLAGNDAAFERLRIVSWLRRMADGSSSARVINTLAEQIDIGVHMPDESTPTGGEDLAHALASHKCESCEAGPPSTWCSDCIIEDYQASCGCAKCVVSDVPPSETARREVWVVGAFGAHEDRVMAVFWTRDEADAYTGSAQLPEGCAMFCMAKYVVGMPTGSNDHG